MPTPQIDFEWDPDKAARNVRKHGVRFETAATVFMDPLAMSVADDECEFEERWVPKALPRTENFSSWLILSMKSREVERQFGSFRQERPRGRSARPTRKDHEEGIRFLKCRTGKVLSSQARLNIPVYLGEDVQRYATEKARDQGIAVEQFVNEVLRKQALADGFSGG